MDYIEGLTKKSCIDTKKKCNEIEPYSENILNYTLNPETKRKYTEEEKENKRTQYKNMCNTDNKHIDLINCCDPYNPLYKNFIEKMKNIYIKKIFKKGEVVGYLLCKTKDCGEDFHKIKPHDMCKLSKVKNLLENLTKEDGIVEVKKGELVPDCFTSICSNSKFIPFLDDPFTIKLSNAKEYKMIESMKIDDVESVKEYYKDVGKDKLNVILKNGYPGNTILHEAIANNAIKCLEWILTNSLEYNIKNKDGNTAIQLAILSENEYITYRLIKLGAALDIRNNYGDTILHSAVRTGNHKLTNLIIHFSGNVITKNNFGETALHVAIMSPKKNIKIVTNLVNVGSDLLTKNNNGDNMLKSLSKFKNTKKNAEIRSLILRELVKRHNDEYLNIIKENPEMSIIEIENKDTQEIDTDLSKYTINNDNLEIMYPDEQTGSDVLYDNKNILPEKELPESIDKELIENFENNNKNYSCNLMLKVSTIILISLILLIITFKLV